MRTSADSYYVSLLFAYHPCSLPALRCEWLFLHPLGDLTFIIHVLQGTIHRVRDNPNLELRGFSLTFALSETCRGIRSLGS